MRTEGIRALVRLGTTKLLRVAVTLSCASLGLLCLRTTLAEEHEINTRAAVWVPLVLFIEPGDTVVWHGMSGHETELIEGMAPTGAMLWRSALDEEGFRVTFDKEGAYIYKCHTHMSAGMVGAIVVGGTEPRNLDAIDAAVANLDGDRRAVEQLIARLKREVRRRQTRR